MPARRRRSTALIIVDFVLGAIHPKGRETLLSIAGRKISAAIVSRVAKTLDTAPSALHRRPSTTRYTALMPIPLRALGLRPDGKRETIGLPLGDRRERRPMGGC